MARTNDTVNLVLPLLSLLSAFEILFCKCDVSVRGVLARGVCVLDRETRDERDERDERDQRDQRDERDQRDQRPDQSYEIRPE